MSESDTAGALGGWYEERIGEATTDDEITGYWLFFLGVITGIIGLVIFSVTEAATTPRGVGYAIAGLSPMFIMLGAIVRFPLRRVATYLAYAGAGLSVLALAWFLVIFPGGWDTETGHLGIIAAYTVGLAVIGVAGAFVPMITDPVRQDYERLQREAAETAKSLDRTQSELAETETRRSALEAEVSTVLEELAGMQESKARFEVYKDRGGSYRWRLRHRNGNIIGDSGEGYSSKQKCQQGLESVRTNATGAGVLDLRDEEEPADAEKPTSAIIDPSTPAESNATFETYEDQAGEWRWRLRHENGNILADSGEGYASRSNLERALDSVREHIAAGSYLDIDPVAYEVYQDAAGEHRWRLLHQNGNVLADSGEGYASQSGARAAVERVGESLAEAEVSEQ